MPTSPYAHLYSLVVYLDALRPKSILDVGLGNGKLGFIARDLLDVMIGERYRQNEWQLKLDGIEVYEDYIQDHQRALYNEIYIGDAFEIIDQIGQYDLIIMGDVLEHFDKQQGMAFMDKCFSHANEAVCLFVPLGDGWPQDAIYGNPYETHRSVWHLDEFLPMCSQHQVIDYDHGQHGSFLIHKDRYIDKRIKEIKGLSFLPEDPRPSGMLPPG